MRCGPFELDAPLGAGGMAAIWRAHLGSARVALKFVALEGDRARQLFAQEVRAVAALDHPGIIHILDHGELDAAIEGGPAAGTPWMALELASGGDLTKRLATLDWERTRVVLLALLDALAHAHAHGVIHRDLKPGNVLLSTLEDPRPGLKLADFGIAHLLHAAVDTPLEGVTGTPTILAPEQCRGAIREYGPWTDLYALGCLTWRMVAGRYPFHGLRGIELLRAHVQTPAPPFEPRFAVPDGLAAWVDRLLQKAPSDRFRSAAEAADALADLPALGARRMQGSLGVTRTQVLAQARGPGRDWRQPARPAFPHRYVQAGLGLLPLRLPQTVGRGPIADAAFAVLREVRDTQRPHVLVLEGARGVGRSHTARWLARRAEEHGLAWALETTGGAGAIERWIATLARADGAVGARAIAASLSAWGPPPPQLCDVVAGVLDGTVTEPIARRGALKALLTHRVLGGGGRAGLTDRPHGPSGLRPLWLVLDDLRDPEVAEAVVELRALWLPLLLCVVPAPGTALPDALRDHPDTRVLTLEPLPDADMSMLVGNALPVAPSLSSRIREAAEGRPAVAMYHLHALAGSGRLRPSKEGLGIEGPWALPTVRTAPQAAALRLKSLVVGLDKRSRRALAIAAVLGAEVDRDLWALAVEGPSAQRAVALADALAWIQLEERMIRTGDAISTRRGWRFAGSLRDAVLERARGPLLREAQRSVALALSSTDPPGDPVRIARLQHAAGELGAAFEGLERAILASHPSLRVLIGANACTDALEIADALGIPANDPRRAPFHARRLASLAGEDGSYERAGLLLTLAREHGWPLLEGMAHATLAALASANRDTDAIDPNLAGAEAALAALPESAARADAENLVAWTYYRTGRYAEARAVLDRVMPTAMERGWAGILAYAQMIESGVRRLGGDPLPASEVQQRADAQYAQGHLLTAASMWVDAAEQFKALGDLDASDALNTRAGDTLELIGMSPIAPHVNRAINAFLRHDAVGTRRWVDRAVDARRGPEWTIPVAVLEVAWASLGNDDEIVRERLESLERTLELPGHDLVPEDREVLELVSARLSNRSPELRARTLDLFDG
ncbi:MAG: protein kinase [Myxococcota bacterium]